jgi:hypothetical protein
MEKISVAFAGLAVIIAMTILQGSVGTARTAGTQCAKPTLIPSDARHATMTVTVRIATKTAGLICATRSMVLHRLVDRQVTARK